jgi:hypothetical protein
MSAPKAPKPPKVIRPETVSQAVLDEEERRRRRGLEGVREAVTASAQMPPTPLNAAYGLVLRRLFGGG